MFLNMVQSERAGLIKINMSTIPLSTKFVQVHIMATKSHDD